MSKKEKQLWIVVSEDEIDAFKTLKDAVNKFDNLAKFIVDKGKIVSLTYSMDNKKPGEQKATWEIEEESLEKIAQAILTQKEGK